MKFIYGKQDWKTLERGEEYCYLMTNGLGGFSSLSLVASVSRNDQAVLMACTHSPNHRYNMIHRLEEQLCYPLIERTQGGAVGGVSVLTDRGREFLAKYTEYDKKVRDIAEDLFDAYFGGMF